MHFFHQSYIKTNQIFKPIKYSNQLKVQSGVEGLPPPPRRGYKGEMKYPPPLIDTSENPWEKHQLCKNNNSQFAETSDDQIRSPN